ncbi:MAG: hypothetical protein NTX26_02220 [Candidatus Parcubacteria bacterium]|nr:hypothetical protein [Candidatus Parcubacteria bacterium]
MSPELPKSSLNSKPDDKARVPEWLRGANQHAQEPTPDDVIARNKTREEAIEAAGRGEIGFFEVVREQKKVLHLTAFVKDIKNDVQELYCEERSKPPFYRIIVRNLAYSIDADEEGNHPALSKETFNKLNTYLAGIFFENR